MALLLVPSAFTGHRQATLREARLRLAAVPGRWEQWLLLKGTVPGFFCIANGSSFWRQQLGQPGCVSGCAGIGQIVCAPLQQPVPLPFSRGSQRQSQHHSPTALLQLPIVCATAAANATDV